MNFDNFIKFSVKIYITTNGKKNKPTHPKEWQKLTNSKYNGEDNFAVLTGKINNIIVIDLDKSEEEKTSGIGFKAFDWYKEKFGEFDTFVTNSFSGGFHVFFKYDSRVDKNTSNKHINIDIRATGGCIYQGIGYEAINDLPIRELSDNEIGFILEAQRIKTKSKSNKSGKGRGKRRKADIEDLSDNNIKNLLDMLPRERYTDRNMWLNIGMILKSISNIDIWHYFSTKWDNYSKEDTDIAWNSFTDEMTNGKTLATLENLAKLTHNYEFQSKNKKQVILRKKSNICEPNGIDHQKQTSEIHMSLIDKSVKYYCNSCNRYHTICEAQQNTMYQQINVYMNNEDDSIIIKPELQLQVSENPIINELLYKSLKNEDSHICKIIYETFKEKYIYVDDSWYMYNNIIWKLINEQYPTELLLYLQDEITEMISSIHTVHLEEQNIQKEQLSLLSKTCKSINKKLLKNHEDTSYVSASKKFFIVDNQFNQQKNLIAFKNGIYDLDTFTFRDGLPTDYLTVQLDYSYDEPNFEKSNIIKNFLSDILPIESVKHFLMENIAKCLYGGENKEQEFYILTGKRGSNGKSLLANLLEQVFGGFYESCEPTLITKPRENANEANSALVALTKARIAFTSEPNKRDKILSDNLKKFTGGDTITVRELHKTSSQAKINLKMFMLCNGIPLLDECKDAEIRRLCIVNFPNRFCTKPNPKLSNEKLIDMNLKEKLLECKNEFFNILIYYLKNPSTLEKPPEVTSEIKKYIKNNRDDIDANEFIEEFLVEKEKSRIFCNDVYKSFTEWCKSESKTKMKKIEFYDLVEEYFPKINERNQIRINSKQSPGWIDIDFKTNVLGVV